jgi:hypothetical protein
MWSIFISPARRYAALACLTALAACSTPAPSFQQEQFDTGVSPYARNYDSSSADSCEAARRALLSQGYMTTPTGSDAVDGTKNFQPSGDSHVVVSFHVVCTAGETAGSTSIVYVNAVQDGYALKKSNTSASVGLSVLGSLSLPIGSSSDAMVRISSETIPAGTFYDRFFGLIDHYLKTVVRASAVPESSVASTPLPTATEPPRMLGALGLPGIAGAPDTGLAPNGPGPALGPK